MQKIKSLLSFLRLLLSHFRWKIALIVIFGVLFSFFQGVSIVMIIPLLESFQSQKDSVFTPVFELLGWEQGLSQLLLFYFMILLGYALFKALQILYTQRTLARFSNQFAAEAMNSLLNANWEFYLKVPSSQIINLMKTESRSVRILATMLFQAIQGFILLIIQLVFALWISVKLTLLLLLILSILFLIQRFVYKANYNLGKGNIGLSENLQKYFNETFKGIKLLKLHRLEMKKGKEYEEHLDQVFQNDMKRSNIDAFSDLLYTLSGALVIILMIWLSMSYQILSIPSLLVLLVLFSRVISQTLSLVQTTGHINNMLPSFDRFSEIVNLAKASAQQNSAKAESKKIASLELKNIHFSFGEKKILDNLNLKLESGKFYVFTGPSGVGKTITSDLICGLITPQKGDIIIDGKKVNGEELLQYQASIGYVLQDTVLFGTSIRNNITFNENYSDADILEAAHKAGLKTLLDKLPEGLEAIVKEDNRGFSGGEMQRIAIARALIRKTPLIIMDEVTNALDRRNEDIILSTINEIKKDSIVVLITHKEYLFDLADEVIRL
ncbi:MAG: ATP-binding cassette domain-containing protein [Flavobacteriales bacterium]